MNAWIELGIDLLSFGLIVAGVALISLPAGLIVAGIGVFWLGAGAHARLQARAVVNALIAREVETE